MTSDKRVQPKELFVTNVFEGTEYVIPIYQRSFAWRKDEIEQLLNDINDVQIELGVKYYLGSLIVNQIGGNRFEVIDGQQRLTTLYLLLAFLKDSSINKYSLSFEVREKSNRALQAIASIKDTKKELDEEPDYSLEIMEGYSVIRKYFEGRLEPFFENFIKKLAAVSIIRTQVPKDIDLNHYFEVMNTRGEQLELHEIVKAKIIGAIKSEDAEKDSKDKMIAATIWDACAQMDKYVQMCFSVARRNKLFGDNWDSFSCDSFDDIREKFKDETKPDETKPDETKTTLLAMLEKPQQPNNNNKEDEENEDNVRFEAIIRFPNFILQVNEAMSITETDDDAGLDDKQFIESLKGNWSSRDKALAFIYSLLKFRYLFDRYIIKREYVGQNKVEGRWSLKRLECNRDDNENKLSILYSPTLDSPTPDSPTPDSGKEEKKEDAPPSDNDHLRLLESCLRITYTSPKTMHWIARVIAAINKDTTGKDIIKLLEIYCCNKVADAAKEGKPKFPIERIVFTYLDYVIWRENIICGKQNICKKNIILEDKAEELKAFQFQFRTSIEHFFPQNPINEKTGVDENKKDSFGNLALITVSANSKFSNLLPDQKVKTYEDVIKQSPKLMLMKRLLDNNSSEWNKEMVEQHEKDMLELLKRELETHRIINTLDRLRYFPLQSKP